ncbi:hypothetical protein L7F22_051229 [Adiantum nelumboides]|nr:hypothetical protein [Adiantum nelumboides]
MDQFVTRDSNAAAEAPSREPRLITWKHALTEVTGRIDSSLKHTVLQYMLRSFSEIGSYPQYVNSQTLSPSRFDHGFDAHQGNPSHPLPPLFLGGRIIHRSYISGLAFDSTGVYLAAVTNNGSLAIHDYESLICHAQGSKGDSVTAVMQLLVCPHLEAVAWNPQNQDEVACVAGYVGKLLCYDISRFSNDPSQVLKVSARAEKVESTGLSDLAFCKLGEKRILASGKKHGEMYLWDRRTNTVPQSVFSSLQHNQLNSLALTRDEQVVYAGSTSGHFLAWDLRGGRSSTAFITPGAVYNPPFATLKMQTLLEQIPALTAQTAIEMSGVQSISLNQCCEQQLAFHLVNGWSGVLDLSTLKVSHIHCPPPPWHSVEGEGDCVLRRAVLLHRKPTWLSAHSIYACPSFSSSKIKLLDFNLGPSSPHKVEATEDEALAKHVEVSTSVPVTTLAAHPLNDQFVAGTMEAAILVFGDKGEPTTSENEI